MPGDGHDRHIARLRLGQLRDACVTQIMKAAVKTRTLEGVTPCGAPALGWSVSIYLAILAPRKHVMVMLGAPEAAGPADQRCECRGIECNKTPSARFRFYCARR